MRFSTGSKRLLNLIAIAAVAGAMAAVPAASARSGVGVRARVLPLPTSSLESAGSLRMQSDSAQYTLTVVETGPSGTVIGPPVEGYVTSSPAGIDCPATCSHAFTAVPGGVTLLATADPNSAFAHWAGCTHVYRDQCDVTLDRDKTVTAYFLPKEPALTVKLSAPHLGTVTSTPAGIDCPAACTVWAPPGTQFTLTATAKPASTFRGWVGQMCFGTGTCVVTLPTRGYPLWPQAFFTVNSPPLMPCVVPSVKDKTLAAAKRTITSHHCSVGEITKVKSSPKNKGHVISQNPRAGKHRENGARVALKLGK